MEAIDRKFRFTGKSLSSGKTYTHRDAIVFLAKDALLPGLLDKYLDMCIENKVDERQIKGIELLIDRVLKYQRINKKVSIPDVNEGKEEKRVCKPNK